MIPALVVLYILLIVPAAVGSLWSYRLSQRYGLPFLKTYHVFVLLSFAYALMNLIGEVFAPAILGGPPASLVRVYMIVDLITIPLLGLLFFLLFSWIARLLGRRVPPTPKAVFWGIEALFLAAFIISFMSYFARGISTLTSAGVLILNGIVAVLLIAAVLLLFFAAPEGKDPNRRRLARGLGACYAVSLAILGASLAAPLETVFRDPLLAHAIPVGLLFMFNLPALIFLRRSLSHRPLPQYPAPPEEKGLAGLAHEARISEREREIIRLVALGLGNREIGKKLFISPKTVKNHITSIYAKTGARNRVQLANLIK